jgi:hypothetical protein
LVAIVATLLVFWGWSEGAEAATCRGLKSAAAAAGISVQGTKWVSVPKDHDWRKALPLYNDLKDYDVELLPLECRQLARLLKAKVGEIVQQHGVLLRVRLTGDAYRVEQNLALLIDGQPARTSLDTQDPGDPFTPGRHEMTIEVTGLRPEEKVVLKPSLNGADLPLGGGGHKFSFELEPKQDGSTQDLALFVSVVRRCVFTLRVNNETEQDPKKRAVLVLHGASSLPLPSGAVRVAGGRHALEVELEEDSSVDVAIDGRQLLPTGTAGRNVRYVVPLECPKGQDWGRASLVVSLPHAELVDTGDDGSDGLPTLFWVGAGGAAGGLLLSTVSYFGFQSPAEDRGNNLFENSGCGSGGNLCDGETQRRIDEAWDESDSAKIWTVAGLVLGGVGAAVAVGALLFDSPEEEEPEAASLQLQPALAPSSFGVMAVGRF